MSIFDWKLLFLAASLVLFGCYGGGADDLLSQGGADGGEASAGGAADAGGGCGRRLARNC